MLLCCAQIVLSTPLKNLLHQFCQTRLAKDATRPEATQMVWDEKAGVSKWMEAGGPTPAASAGISGDIVWGMLEFGSKLKDDKKEGDLTQLSVNTLQKMNALFGSEANSFPNPL